MKLVAAALAALLLAACSRVTEENYAKIRDGMSEQEVIAILGKPTESSSLSIAGLSGTGAKWVEGDAVIAVQFVNGKVLSSSFRRASAKK
jgi:hypothetical protein